MIAILEGATGVGKTTLAKKLSERTGWPVYRAFRPGTKSHLPGGHDPRLALLPMSINTWREDLYVADVLATVKPNVILDRSVPSGIAYDDTLSYERRMNVISLWGERMKAVGRAVLVLMGVPDPVRVERGARTGTWEQPTLLKICQCVANYIPVYTMNTILPVEVCEEALYHCLVLGKIYESALKRIDADGKPDWL